jgi:hypothetical protein
MSRLVNFENEDSNEFIEYKIQPITKNETQISFIGNIFEVEKSKIITIKKTKKKLWQTSCFEAFWHTDAMQGYKELNVSAEGEWNIYSFASYRDLIGYSNEDEVIAIKKTIEAENRQNFSITVKHSTILSEAYFSICYLKYRNHDISYWSNLHENRLKPDFHNIKARNIKVSY